MKTSGDVEASQKQLAQMRGDLLTVATRVSHDLRAPLSGILSAAEALREMCEEGPSANRALLDSLVVSAEELSRMIKDVSFVLKATANPQPKELVKMDSVFAFALLRQERQIVKSGATIAQPPSWPSVQGVAQWLEMTWSIFLGFALQRGGDSPKIETGCREGNGEKIFYLRDGMDVPPEQRNELFQSFESLHQLNSMGSLNFAVARRLMELQGGRCGCDEKSIFFTLPG